MAAEALCPTRPLDLFDAREQVRCASLAATDTGPVGLGLESHLVDLAKPPRRVPWPRLRAALAGAPDLPGGSRVTVEPGGQVELSGPPGPGVVAAVAALRADRRTLAEHLENLGLGLAALGADPLRPPRRVNPGARYVAMEQHFAARGTGAAGLAMMTSTASLQVNLEAGPADGWADRVRLAHRLGPVLVAVSACSTMLAGAPTGWRSARQRVWGLLDEARCGPLLGGDDPAGEWADYSLAAPVLLVRDGAEVASRAQWENACEEDRAERGRTPDRRADVWHTRDRGAVPVLDRVSFAAWIAGAAPLGGRQPTAADLAYHLSTLFPPVRLRGFVEIRYLDAAPEPWWPALVAVTTVLMDDTAAAAAAMRATAPVAGAWERAARDGLADPALHEAARRCLALAVDACPAGLSAEVEALAELVGTGRSPGDTLADDPAARLLTACGAGQRGTR